MGLDLLDEKLQETCTYRVKYPEASLKELAEILCTCGNVKLHYQEPSIKEKQIFNPMSNSSLNSTKLESLGWRGLFSPEEGLAHTVDILKSVLID